MDVVESQLSSLLAELEALRVAVAHLEQERAQAELDHAKALEEMGDVVRARDEFLAVAAHELRNPMAAMMLQVQGVSLMLRKEGRGPEDRVLVRLTALERHINHFIKRASALLDVSRLAAGKAEMVLEELDLAAIVHDVVERIQPEIERSGSSLTIELGTSVMGMWDRLSLELIASNLASNAVKYGGGRPIAIGVQALEKEARLVVRDEGIGIPEEDQARIFERFERAVTKKTHGGFGVGLWIVRQVTTALGGDIAVESAPGRGSTFTVTLPRSVSGVARGDEGS
jgi:signal transduction histidine kinase